MDCTTETSFVDVDALDHESDEGAELFKDDLKDAKSLHHKITDSAPCQISAIFKLHLPLPFSQSDQMYRNCSKSQEVQFIYDSFRICNQFAPPFRRIFLHRSISNRPFLLLGESGE